MHWYESTATPSSTFTRIEGERSATWRRIAGFSLRDIVDSSARQSAANWSGRGLRTSSFARTAELDLTDRASGARVLPAGTAGICLSCCGQGWRNPCQRHLSRRFHPRKSRNSDQCHRRELSQAECKRLLFLGSSCIYPKLAPQPIKEEYLLTGPLEPTNRAYALAKIAGIEMCWSYNRQFGTQYLAAMPTNLYGPGDNFDPKGITCATCLDAQSFRSKARRRKEAGGMGHRSAAPRISV